MPRPPDSIANLMQIERENRVAPPVLLGFRRLQEGWQERKDGCESKKMLKRSFSLASLLALPSLRRVRSRLIRADSEGGLEGEGEAGRKKQEKDRDGLKPRKISPVLDDCNTR